MAEKISKTQRWLDLIAYLLGRRLPVTVEEIMEAVPAYAGALDAGDDKARGAARRMFERDKDELRHLGVPLETVSYTLNFGMATIEGYQLSRRDFYLPYLKLLAEQQEGSAKPRTRGEELELSAEEAGLALDAVRRVADLPAFPFAAEARSAFRKVGFDLDPDRFTDSSVLWVDPPHAGEVLERLRILSSALLGRKRVRFSYRGIYRGETTERDVAPYGLFFQRDWYLVGRDAVRDALRVFRVARMDDLQANARSPKTADYEIPADFRLEKYLQRDAWELGEGEEPPVHAEIRFHFPASLLAERNRAGELVEQRSDGSTVRRFEVQQVGPFLRWVLSQEGEAEILGPPELRVAMQGMVDSVAALYGGEATHG
jgi:proteasome accessory factor B